MSSTDGALGRVRDLVAPIVADLGLEIWDLEHVSGVLRLTVDTPAGGPAGVALDTIALCSRSYKTFRSTPSTAAIHAQVVWL